MLFIYMVSKGLIPNPQYEQRKYFSWKSLWDADILHWILNGMRHTLMKHTLQIYALLLWLFSVFLVKTNLEVIIKYHCFHSLKYELIYGHNSKTIFLTRRSTFVNLRIWLTTRFLLQNIFKWLTISSSRVVDVCVNTQVIQNHIRHSFQINVNKPPNIYLRCTKWNPIATEAFLYWQIQLYHAVQITTLVTGR